MDTILTPGATGCQPKIVSASGLVPASDVKPGALPAIRQEAAHGERIYQTSAGVEAGTAIAQAWA
jgi:hypothetical protein